MNNTIIEKLEEVSTENLKKIDPVTTHLLQTGSYTENFERGVLEILKEHDPQLYSTMSMLMALRDIQLFSNIFGINYSHDVKLKMASAYGEMVTNIASRKSHDELMTLKQELKAIYESERDRTAKNAEENKKKLSEAMDKLKESHPEKYKTYSTLLKSLHETWESDLADSHVLLLMSLNHLVD